MPSERPRKGFRSILGRFVGICCEEFTELGSSEAFCEWCDEEPPSTAAKSVTCVSLIVGTAGMPCADGRLIDDLRFMFRSTMLSTCSLETLTTRWDILRSMVPVRASGDSRDPGDNERFRLEGETLSFELEESWPASRLLRSSPRRESLLLRPLL